MDWDTLQQADDDRTKYRDRVKNQAINLRNGVVAWQNEFDALYASASPENQAIMDATKATFVANIKTALGIG